MGSEMGIRDRRAQTSLGYMNDDGQGVEQDDEAAVQWYRLAADKGYAPAQNNPGGMSDLAQGVEQDYEEAVRWYRLAADQGHARAPVS